MGLKNRMKNAAAITAGALIIGLGLPSIAKEPTPAPSQEPVVQEEIVDQYGDRRAPFYRDIVFKIGTPYIDQEGFHNRAFLGVKYADTSQEEDSYFLWAVGVEGDVEGGQWFPVANLLGVWGSKSPSNESGKEKESESYTVKSAEIAQKLDITSIPTIDLKIQKVEYENQNRKKLYFELENRNETKTPYLNAGVGMGGSFKGILFEKLDFEGDLYLKNELALAIEPYLGGRIRITGTEPLGGLHPIDDLPILRHAKGVLTVENDRLLKLSLEDVEFRLGLEAEFSLDDVF